MDEHAARIGSMRKDKDQWFRYAADSPIEDRASFAGLSYFPVDPALRFRVKLVRHARPRAIVMQTSDGAVREYSNVGHFEVTVEGANVQVQAYQAPGADAIFVPFRDRTSGKETYGAGRYLDLHPIAPGDEFDLDLNLAYNPMCAYSDAFSCPFPPPENWLPVAVRAGEKSYG